MEIYDTLPFGIDFVVEEDLGSDPDFRILHQRNDSFDITCPFCGGIGKMNVNTAKNVARCNKCGLNHGFNSITLHAELKGITNSESYHDLMNLWNGNGLSYSGSVIKKESRQNAVLANIKVRDTVYRKLLSCLTLSPKHRADLKRRGLSDEDIEKGMYKSYPYRNLHGTAYRCIFETGAAASLEKHPDWGIPGFCYVHSTKKVKLVPRKKGYLIPVIQKDGLISGMQIRYDPLSEDATPEEKENYSKYTWFSSSEYESGCSVSGCENIHFAGNWNEIPETVNLTEGILKADVASALSGKCFLGLAGVNNIKNLKSTLSYLSYNGVKKINICVDMDYRTKKEVAAALECIKKEINAAGKLRYTAILCKGNEGIIDGASENGCISIVFREKIPENVKLFIGRSEIPPKAYVLEENVLSFKNEWLDGIKNSRHVLAVTIPDGNKLKLFSEITFIKTGLSYETVEWDEKYKGIDDYYLSLKEKGIMI